MKKIIQLITIISLASLIASCSGDVFDKYQKTREDRIVPGPVVDRSAPTIGTAEAIDSDRIRITFNENVDAISAQVLANYHIQGINRVIVQSIELPAADTVDLVLWTDNSDYRMKSGIPYTLLVQNVADESLNAINYRTFNFIGKGWVVATMTSDVPASTNSATANIAVAGDNIVGYQYSIDNGPWSQEYSSAASIALTGLVEGAHELRVIGKHSDGSWQEINYSSKLNWTVDLTPPEARIASAPDAITEATDVKFNFTGTDVTAYKYFLESTDAPLIGTWSDEAPSSETLSLFDLDAGSYTISIIGKDSAGNWQEEVDATVYNFRIIDEGQVVVVLSDLPDEKSHEDSTDITVGGVGAYYYAYSIDGSDWSSLISLVTPLELTGLSQGSHTIRVRGADFSATLQPEENAIEYTWTIDNIAPTAILENLPALESSDRSAYVTVTGDEIVQYRFKLDGSTWSGYYTVTDPIEINSLTEGSHTLEVSAVDEFGNEQSDQLALTEHTWTIDITAPTAALTGTPVALSNIDSIDITVEGTDVTGYKYKLDTGAWSAERTIAEHIDLTSLAETSHQLLVIGRDQAGNWQEIDAPTTVAWTIDATAPIASLSNVPADPTPMEDIQVIVGGPGVVSYKYKLDEGSWQDGGDADYGIGISVPIENGSALSETTHNLYVIARDAAGNWQTVGDQTVATWRVDTTVPEAVLTGTPDAYTTSTSASITVGGDSVDLYRYRVDTDPSWSAADIPVATPIDLSGLADGQHAVYVIGHRGIQWQPTAAPTVYYWTVDTTAPTAELDNKPNDVTNETAVNITVEGIGVTHYKYSLDNASPNWAAMSEIDAVTPITDSPLSVGTHTVYVIARDAAGNWQTDGDRTSYTWEIDLTSAVATVTNVPGSPTSMTSADILVGPLTLEGFKYRYSTDGSAPDDEVWSPVLPIEQHIVLDSLPDSTIILEVIGKDIYGNWQEESAATTETWTIDTSLPAAKLTGLPSEQTTSTGLDVTVGTESGSAAVVSYKYKLDENAWEDGGDADNGIVYTTHINTSGLADGYHRLYVIGRSESGMWQSISNATAHTWKIDSSAPTAMLTNTPPDGGDTTNTYVNITVGGDGVVAYKYQFNNDGVWHDNAPEDGFEVSNTISLNSSDLEAGNSYNLKVLGRDSIGNWQSTPTELDWNVVFIEAPKVNSSQYESDILVSFTWGNPANTGNVEIQVAGAKADGTADFDNPLYQDVITNVEYFNYIADTETNGSRYFARIKVQDTSSNWSVNWGDASDGAELVGSISGLVKDQSDNLIDGATITLRYVSDNTIVQTNEETPVDISVQTGSDGRFVVNNVPAGTNRFFILCEYSGAYTVKNNIAVSVGENTDVGTLLISTGSTSGDITGIVVDANTADLVDGATVTAWGWNNGSQAVEAVGTATSNASGVFTMSSVPAGTYSIVVSNDFYFDLTVDNQVIDGNLDMGRQAICEVLTEPQVRVILLWGEYPGDLDIHLVGPTEFGDSSATPNDRFHVYYGNISFDEETGDYYTEADQTGTMYTASLVQDVTDYYVATDGSYGPEAINIYRASGVQYSRGVYTYSVHNYSKYDSASNSNWSESIITMRVYDSEGLVREIPFPSEYDESEDTWKAVKIDIQGVGRSNRKVHVVNQFDTILPYSKSGMDW